MNRRYAQLRKFVDITQYDVSVHTGIALHRISGFERGVCELSAPELAAFGAFLAERLRMELRTDANDSELRVVELLN